MKPSNVGKVALATIALHNYLRLTDQASYCLQGYLDSETATGEIIPGHWRSEATIN